LDIISFGEVFTVQNIPVHTMKLIIKALNYSIVNDIYNPDDVEIVVDLSNALYYKIVRQQVASKPPCDILLG